MPEYGLGPRIPLQLVVEDVPGKHACIRRFEGHAQAGFAVAQLGGGQALGRNIAPQNMDERHPAGRLDGCEHGFYPNFLAREFPHPGHAAIRVLVEGFINGFAKYVDGAAAIGLPVGRKSPGVVAHQLLAAGGPEQAQGRSVAVDVPSPVQQHHGIAALGKQLAEARLAGRQRIGGQPAGGDIDHHQPAARRGASLPGRASFAPAFELGEKSAAIFALQRQLAAYGAIGGLHPGQKLPEFAPAGWMHKPGKAPPRQTLAHGSQLLAAKQVELPDNPAGTEGEIADRGEVVEVAVFQTGRFGSLLGQQQRFALPLQLSLVRL